MNEFEYSGNNNTLKQAKYLFYIQTKFIHNWALDLKCNSIGIGVAIKYDIMYVIIHSDDVLTRPSTFRHVVEICSDL